MFCILLVGRKKIDIKMITSEKNRQVTFNKRRVGLMKKAMELSILCGCEVGLVVLFDRKMHVYASSPIDEIIRRYHGFEGTYEALSNEDRESLQPGRSSSFKMHTQRMKGRRPPCQYCGCHQANCGVMTSHSGHPTPSSVSGINPYSAAIGGYSSKFRVPTYPHSNSTHSPATHHSHPGNYSPSMGPSTMQMNAAKRQRLDTMSNGQGMFHRRPRYSPQANPPHNMHTSTVRMSGPDPRKSGYIPLQHARSAFKGVRPVQIPANKAAAGIQIVQEYSQSQESLSLAAQAAAAVVQTGGRAQHEARAEEKPPGPGPGPNQSPMPPLYPHHATAPEPRSGGTLIRPPPSPSSFFTSNEANRDHSSSMMHMPTVPSLSPFGWGTPTPSGGRQSFSKIPGHPDAPTPGPSGMRDRTKAFVMQEMKTSNQSKPLSMRRGFKTSSLNLSTLSKPKPRVVELPSEARIGQFTSPVPNMASARPPKTEIQTSASLPPLPSGLPSGLAGGFPTPLGGHRSNPSILTPSITNLMSFGSPLRSACGTPVFQK
ncbi:hypothetical protein AAMO2058_000154800 [Amorphochlora amoebiformis]